MPLSLTTASTCYVSRSEPQTSSLTDPMNLLKWLW